MSKIKMIKDDVPKYNKYIVFEFNYYEASGGIDDISQSFDDLNDAILYIEKTCFNISYIIDRDSWKMVYEYNYFT